MNILPTPKIKKCLKFSNLNYIVYYRYKAKLMRALSKHLIYSTSNTYIIKAKILISIVCPLVASS